MPQNFTRKGFLFAETVKNAPKLYKKTRQEDRNAPKTATLKKISPPAVPLVHDGSNSRPQKEKERTGPHRYAAETHPDRRHHRLPHHECFFSVSKVHKSDTESSEKILFFLKFLYC